MEQISYSASPFGLKGEKSTDTRDASAVIVRLDQPVDPERLRRAVQQAERCCPFLRLQVVIGEDGLCYYRETKEPLVPQKECWSRLDQPENGGHFAMVCYQDHEIAFYIAHILTDGAGLLQFVRATLDAYYTAEQYTEEKLPDLTKDPLKEPLPVSEGYEPPAEIEDATFVLEEKLPPSEHDLFSIRIRRDKYRQIMNAWDGSAQTILTRIAAGAVADAYPDNRKRICVRIPVNARSLLGMEDTFQNGSLANLHISLSSEELSENTDQETVSEIARQIGAQRTRDYLFYQHNQWRDMVMETDRQEKWRKVAGLSGNATMVVSNLGSPLAKSPWEGHLEASLSYARMFPLMLYSMDRGDKMDLSLRDATGDHTYLPALLRLLEGLSLEPQLVMEK